MSHGAKMERFNKPNPPTAMELQIDLWTGVTLASLKQTSNRLVKLLEQDAKGCLVAERLRWGVEQATALAQSSVEFDTSALMNLVQASAMLGEYADTPTEERLELAQTLLATGLATLVVTDGYDS